MSGRGFKILEHARSVLREVLSFISALQLLGKPRKVQVEGIDFFLHKTRLVSGAMLDGSYEREDTRSLKHLTKQSEMVVNIGANVGWFPVIAGAMGVPSTSFEPNLDNFRILMRNLASNNLEGIATAFPLAVSDKNMLSSLYGEGTGSSLVASWQGTRGNGAATQTIALDEHFADIFTGRCLFIIDVEGSEGIVLDGMAKLLAKLDHCAVSIEISGRQTEISRKLEALGFDVRNWTRTRVTSPGGETHRNSLFFKGFWDL